MQAQDEERRTQWTEWVTANAGANAARIPAPALKTDVEDEPVKEPEVYLKECASCGGQFPSFRAICSECEDIADVDGYRDGKVKAVASEGTAANS
jgi:uncharacterized OB-fold protein